LNLLSDCDAVDLLPDRLRLGKLRASMSNPASAKTMRRVTGPGVI